MKIQGVRATELAKELPLYVQVQTGGLGVLNKNYRRPLIGTKLMSK